MHGLERVGVVIPVKNEQTLLPACLHSMLRAACRCPVPVDIVLVLDGCTDASAAVAADFALEYTSHPRTSLRVRQITVDNVGRARAEGMEFAIAGADIHGTWLATTDADSTVPPHWLSAQLDHVSTGASVVIGTVRVSDWGDRSGELRARAKASYVVHGHHHVHGANLSFTAAAYRRSGGFQPLSSEEDVALVHAFRAAGETLVWATDLPVDTSARRLARAPDGFAAYLNALEQETA